MSKSTAPKEVYTQSPADKAALALEENQAAVNFLIQSVRDAYFSDSKLDLRGLEFVLVAIQRKNDEIRVLLAEV